MKSKSVIAVLLGRVAGAARIFLRIRGPQLHIYRTFGRLWCVCAPLLVAVLGLGLVVPLFSDPLGLVHHEDDEGLVLRRREERLEEEAVRVEVARVLERLARDGHEVADGRAGGDDVLLDAPLEVVQVGLVGVEEGVARRGRRRRLVGGSRRRRLPPPPVTGRPL